MYNNEIFLIKNYFKYIPYLKFALFLHYPVFHILPDSVCYSDDFFRQKQFHRYLASRNFRGFSQPTPNECPRALFPPHTKLLASTCNLFHTPLSCCYLYCQTRASPETFTATLCTSKYSRVSFTGHISIGLVNISQD